MPSGLIRNLMVGVAPARTARTAPSWPVVSRDHPRPSRTGLMRNASRGTWRPGSTNRRRTLERDADDNAPRVHLARTWNVGRVGRGSGALSERRFVYTSSPWLGSCSSTKAVTTASHRPTKCWPEWQSRTMPCARSSANCTRKRSVCSAAATAPGAGNSRAEFY